MIRLSMPVPLTSTPRGAGSRLRSGLSRAALVLAIGVLGGSFLLISPAGDATFPGAIPWRDGSILHVVVGLLSLNGAVATARGVEIKDLVLHLGAGLGLALLALRLFVSGIAPSGRRVTWGAWTLAQAFLLAWVACSLASAAWSGDAALSLGQATLYALALAWAVSLAWTLESRDIPALLAAYVVVATAAAALTVWYFYERNPYHRPGFPIGNPGPLAACLLPAIVLCLVRLGPALKARPRSAAAWREIGLSVIPLAPLGWAFWLTGSRSGLLAAAAAAAVAAFLHLPRRVRWIAAGCGTALLAVALAWFALHSHDATMARGPTIRFRLYTWQYAAQLWSLRSISGHGAGAFPRYADQLARGDVLLDPAAFMGHNIGHAHNELFEVLVELGLVLGLTFVAGYVATLAAAAALVQSAGHSPQRRGLLIGLTAAVAALLADSAFGPGLRLPGMPAAFYTLLGVLWAASRSVSARLPEGLKEGAARPQTNAGKTGIRLFLRAFAKPEGALALLAAGAAALAFLAASLNWNGVLAEADAARKLAAGDAAAALSHTLSASERLLDPIRRLAARDLAVGLELQLARSGFLRWSASSRRDDDRGSAPRITTDWQAAEGHALAAIQLAEACRTRAPAFGLAGLYRAQAAELLASMHRDLDPAAARRWTDEAWSAWRARLEMRPSELEALLALCAYPERLAERLDCLRRALRAPASPQNWFPTPRWFQRLDEIGRDPQLPGELAVLALNAAPYDPKTDLNVLVLSFAPETWRLRAAWLARGREFAAARDDAQRAVALYAAMRSRFPELYCVALAELAEYTLLATPSEAGRAAARLQDALSALPRIQEQKLAELAAPFRQRLARCLLAAGQQVEARRQIELVAAARDRTLSPPELDAALAALYVQLAADFARRAVAEGVPVAAWLSEARRLQRGSLEAWAWTAWLAAAQGDGDDVEQVLDEARQAGLSADQIERIRRSLAQEFGPPASRPTVEP